VLLFTFGLTATLLGVPGLSSAQDGSLAGRFVLTFSTWPPTWAEWKEQMSLADRQAAGQKAAGSTRSSARKTAASGTAKTSTAPTAEAPAEDAPAAVAPSGTTSTSTAPTTGTTGTTSSGSTTQTGTSTAPSGSTAPAATSGGHYMPYSTDSYFRKPLPASTPVSSESARFVAHAKANEPFEYLKIRGAQGIGWGIAYAMATCADPIYKIGSGGNLPASQAHLRTTGFHAPASIWKNIPPNGDAPFLVVDTCGTSARPGGLSVWGANTVVSGQTVNTSAAGAFAHDTNGLDGRNPRSNSKLNERSRGVIPDSMVIRLDLLDQAIRNNRGLGHVLEVFWMETDSAAGVAHPMVGAEGGKAGVGAEGQRFRIKSNVDLASRPGCNPSTNPVGLAIARTLQQHGAYLGDNSGSGSGIKTEQNANVPGLTQDSLKGCMTWDDIEFLPLGWDG
jgi:hypothetical protein